MTPKPRVPPVTLDFALLRGAIEEVPFGVATTRDNHVVYANGALEHTYGVGPGGLEGKTLAALFGEKNADAIAVALDDNRIFDGRVRSFAFDGTSIEAEVHVERYRSAAGVGGFIVVRDVTLELGALGRLIDQLGGALFRFRTDDRTLEFVSPSIERLIGIESGACAAERLIALVSAEERERLGFLYRRLMKGELPSASAQISAHRPDGTTKLLHMRCSVRRDNAGTVRFIEGVVTEGGTIPPEQVPPSSGLDAPVTTNPPSRRADVPTGAFAASVMDVSGELLRESDQHLHSLGQEMRLLRASLSTSPKALSNESAREIALRLDRMTAQVRAASAMSRRVRRAVRGVANNVTVQDLLDNVRSTLAPSLGDAPLTVIAAPNAAPALLRTRVDEVTLALMHLALRAFRITGSGSLRIFANLGSSSALLIEIVARAPTDELVGSLPANVLANGPRPADVEQAEQAALTILASVGGGFRCEEATPFAVRLVVRIPCG